MNTEEQLVEKWHNLPTDKQQQVLQFIEFLEYCELRTEIASNTSKSLQYPTKAKLATNLSALESVVNLVGSLEAAEDLSTNKDYLKGFGQ